MFLLHLALTFEHKIIYAQLYQLIFTDKLIREKLNLKLLLASHAITKLQEHNTTTKQLNDFSLQVFMFVLLHESDDSSASVALWDRKLTTDKTLTRSEDQ